MPKNTPTFTPTKNWTVCRDGNPYMGGTRLGSFFIVRQEWRVAHKRNEFGCDGHAGDLEVKVLYSPARGRVG